MKIQIMSDLHLEFGDIKIKNAGADALILSGDIVVAADLDQPDPREIYHKTGRKKSAKIDKIENFFKNVSSEFKNVFYVMGNHEHYHGDINKSKKKITDTFEELNINNIHLLEKESVIIDNVIFIGATLWTDCNNECPLTVWKLKRSMSDYEVIRNDKVRLLPEDTVEIHKHTKQFIHNTVQANIDKRIVVVGHHAPSKASTHERYKNDNLMNGGYSSELSDLILDNPNIKLWTHGHTHEKFDYMIGGTRIVCNPRGYYGYEDTDKFDGEKVVEI